MTHDNNSIDRNSMFESIAKYSNFATNISTMILGFTFVVYIIGFIIVNTYLASYGVREFELLKPLYLNAGIGYLFYILFSLVLPAYVFSNLAWLSDKSLLIIFLSAALTSFVVSLFILSSMIVGVIDEQLSSITNLDVLKIGWKFVAMTAATTFIALVLMIPELMPQNKNEETENRSETHNTRLRKYTLPINIFLFVFPFIIVSLALWGTNIFPLIRPEYGGGSPPRVQMVFVDDNASENWVAIGGNATNNISETVLMLSENDKTVILLLANNQAVKIDRQQIKMILYNASQPTSNSP